MSVVLISGASTGIGLATAIQFARRGHTVLAGARNPAGADQLQQASQQFPITIVPLDVDHDDSVAACVRHCGPIDVLVNNAGISGSGPLELVSLETAQQVFNTNYFGAIRLIQAVLPGMRAQGGGTIVNVTSVAGRVASAGMGHYTASKHALEAASEALAAEVLPYGIRVALVEPGVILTPIFSKLSPSSAPPPAYESVVRRQSQFFAKRLENPGTPEQVAAVIEHAVTTTEPRLRYLVGTDAEVLCRGRAACSDEDWIALGNTPSDDEYAARRLQVFGTDFS